jgi:hypothetical protein
VTEIPLTQGKVALIDDGDAHLAAHKWYAARRRSTWYAVRKTTRRDPGCCGRTLLLHREVLRALPGVEVDHKDGNGLDCRRENLRIATGAENTRNQRRRRDNTSGFKGVVWAKRKRYWRAEIHANGKRRSLGCYKRPDDAARAYDAAARGFFGVFAALNFPNDGERAA